MSELQVADRVAPPLPGSAPDPTPLPGRPSRPKAGADRWPPVVRILCWYVASRLVVTFAMALSAARTGFSFDHLFREWDASWYLFVADHGYPSHPIPMSHWLIQGGGHEWAIAFFPGYPLAVAALGVTGFPLVAAGVTISLICGFLATYGLFRLGTACFDGRVGERAAVVFCFFPGALVFSLVYTEALSLALALGCLCALLRRRWLLAGLIAGAASAVHGDIAVAASLASATAAAQAVWRQRDWSSLWAPALAPTGFLAYLAYLQVHTGSWANWLRSERAGWHQKIDFGSREIRSLVAYVTHPLTPAALTGVLGAGACLFLLVALWRRPLPAPVTVAAVAVLALSFSSSDVGLRPRALLAAAPAFISVAAALRDREAKMVSMAFVVLTTLLVSAYLGPAVMIP